VKEHDEARDRAEAQGAILYSARAQRIGDDVTDAVLAAVAAARQVRWMPHARAGPGLRDLPSDVLTRETP